MNTLISGQAGKAIIIQGDEVLILDALNTQEEIVRPKSTVHYYLSGAGDIEFLNLKTKQEVKEVLNHYRKRSLALQLFLIFIDPEEEAKTRLYAGEDLSPYFEDPDIVEHVSNFLYSSPFPKNFDLIFENFSLENFPILYSFIKTLGLSQKAISAVRQYWDDLPLDIFNGDILKKKDFEKQAVSSGIFKKFVQSYSDPTKFGLAWVEAQLELGKLENSRQVLQSWSTKFKPDISEVNLEISIDDSDQTFWFSKESLMENTYFDLEKIFISIDKQKLAITDSLKSGNFHKARKYVDDLISFQLKKGPPEHLAKSLCHLSKLAKDMCNYSVQLEWAQRALDFDPGDVIVHSHIADANIRLCNYTEAIKWLNSIGEKGDLDYKLIGSARIYKSQGKLDQSLETYTEACQKFPEILSGWTGRAEVLRDMWKLEEALEVYEEAILKFPDDNSRPLHGKAFILRILGKFDEAKELLETLIQDFSIDYSYAGMAEVLKGMENFEEAEEIYNTAIDKFPDSYILKNGLANVFKEKGDLPKALKHYEDIISQFPFDNVSWSGRAEVLREMGNLTEALDLYSEGINKFPYSPVMVSGKANILKRLSKYEKSLQAYDQGVLKFPYNIYMLNGRADLLKELGYLEEAIKAYEKVEQLSPRIKSVPHAKAAIYVAMRQFDKADKLIPIKSPQTSDDWIAFHIKCMILLKTKNYKDAKSELEFGLKNIPFASQRKYFENSLMVINLFEGNLKEAGQYLGDDQAPLTNVLRIHFQGESGNLNEAKTAYSKVEGKCTPVLSALREELGVRYKIFPGKTKYSKEWLYEQECNNILLKAA